MSFATLKGKYPRVRDLPSRAFDLAAMRRILDGNQYDELTQEFHDEKNGAGEYIPLRNRRPSVRYPLCRLLVDDSVSLLFGGDHWPSASSENEALQDAINQIVKDSALNETMITAATKGSVGSVALILQILKGRVFVTSMNTEYLTPTWDPEAPDTLKSVKERRQVKGVDLLQAGYDIPDKHLQALWWFQRVWDEGAEQWFGPQLVGDETPPEVDPKRTVNHNLGFVPIVWIKNLPGGNEIDGLPSFTSETVDVQIEIEYLLSQGGRGLKYSADPLLLIKEPAGDDDGAIVRSASNAMVVDKDGDAKLLEINGTASQTIIEWARFLRELALEGAHGNRASAEKLSAAQSGKAMELMNQALIWLVDRLRITYGERGLLELYNLIIKASQKIPLVLKDGTKLGKLPSESIALKWPAWYAPTSRERSEDASTMRQLTDAGLMSRETAIETIAPVYDIEDVQAEQARAQAELDARNAALQPAGVQEKIKITE